MAQVNFYTPTATTWWPVRVWAKLMSPVFTHCNFETGSGDVVDLGRDVPRATHVRDAYRIRPVNGAITLVYEDPWALRLLAAKYQGKRATHLRSALYVLTGIRIGELRNCATLCADWLRMSYPGFPRCYTPDELRAAILAGTKHNRNNMMPMRRLTEWPQTSQ